MGPLAPMAMPLGAWNLPREMHQLVISDNEGTTTVVPLVREEVSIGRKDGNTIRLTERNISRQHAQLQRVNGAYVIRDLNSYNGVLVNGQRVVGESELHEGDEIQIGDYSILVEGAESKTDSPTLKEDEVAEDEPTRVAPIPQPETSPARLVVLGAPAAGAEHTLPDSGQIRLGRAAELEVTIDHRSVSREHATLSCEGGQYRIIDRDSANGVRVNGESVGEARLARGDVVELGEVLIRFVGPGEQYVFDPTEADLHARPAGIGSRNNMMLAAGIVAAAVVAAVFIVSGGEEEPVAAPAIEPVAPKPVAPAELAAEPEAPAPQPAAAGNDFHQLLASCRDAVAGGRFAEAIAHANGALRLTPDAPEAASCLKTAQVNHEEEQTFVRGKAALEAGDAEAAFREFSGLSPHSLFRVRPEVASAVEALGNARLSTARGLLSEQPRRAREIALSVVAIDAMPDPLAAQAKGLAVEAKKAAAAEDKKPSRARASRSRSKSSKSGKAPMEAASACLARGDNACVVRALSGKARTSQELGLLIETYRAMGNTAQAQRNMRLYIQRFPSGKRADSYRRMLARQGP
ncbi:MAG: FHA domain-containing protein [Myxococcales bacterium]|nr:FHA domain-containing protein [Myxococcales bacterium]